MKKKSIAVLLCVYVILIVSTVRLAVYTSGNGTQAPQSEPSRMDIIATAPVSFTTFDDYLFYESELAWSDPAANVGCEALFNIDYYVNFLVLPTEASIAVTEFADCPEIDWEAVTDDLGNSIHIVITDCVIEYTNNDKTEGFLWYKIEAAEGYELPEILKNNPYILYSTYSGEPTALLMLPQMGTFENDTVTLKKQAVAAAKTVEASASDIPDFFNFTVENYHYYKLTDIALWEGIDSDYPYVDESEVTVIPPRITRAYDALMDADSSSEFWTILDNIPDTSLEGFTLKHKTNVEAYIEHLIAIENVTYDTTVNYNGQEIATTVKGKIPMENVTLKVTPVTADTLLSEGFKAEDTESVITALDIKIIDDTTGKEWQPEENSSIEVTIDLNPLGITDDRVVQLQHKHEGIINTYDTMVVIEGKLTFYTGGFSIYVVNNVGNTTPIETINNNGTDNLTVGQRIIYYFSSNGNNGTWTVTDTNGAINYTVYRNATNNVPGNASVPVRYIVINPLRETPAGERITLRYNQNNSYETFYITISSPYATVPDESGEMRKLYIKDTVNANSGISAALVDENGNELSLEGAAFAWTRSDGLFILPTAYEANYSRVNIARDHGGLVEARKKYDNNGRQIGYEPITYNLTATLSDGTKITAEPYTVYYQSEIINSGFEFPAAADNNYSFFPNGWPELYWKTTAQGTGANVSKDIEYGDVHIGVTGNTNYGVPHAADWDENTNTGFQFAELNAEAVGALYQDIITVPEEDIEWKFSHAPRPNQSGWAPTVNNRMFIVIGATEDAQKLANNNDNGNKNNLEDLVNSARTAGANVKGFSDGTAHVEIEYGGAKYWVWYHNAGCNLATNNSIYDEITETSDHGWQKLAGTYDVPKNQYRTRIFFVSDPQDNQYQNAGNLIDISLAGQYRSFLVEYYEETYEGGVKKLAYYSDYDESGESLLYSSQVLNNFSYFDKTQGDYLHHILINDQTYPYDIRFKVTDDPNTTDETAYLYIEKYPGSGENAVVPNIDVVITKNNNTDKPTTDKYKDYDIVMQVFFRDTVIAVQKELEFPKEMTEEQKLTLMENLKNDHGGYKTDFILTYDDPNTVEVETITETAQTVIINRDPAGNYKGFIALGENPPLENYYIVEERPEMELKGLELDSVTFIVQRYSMGDFYGDPDMISYEKITITDTDKPLKLKNPFWLGQSEKLDNDGNVVYDKNGNPEYVSVKIADVNVENSYREKMTNIKYVAVGNGKVSLQGSTEYVDVPFEELAFYSGESNGVTVTAGAGATFVGWYTDPECTIPVNGKVVSNGNVASEGIDGKVDANGTFKPNANIISDDEGLTFYAKFVTSSIVIEKENGEADKSYVYKVEGEGRTMFVSVTCDKDGNGKTEILEVTTGKYTVTEITSWGWRHEYTNPAQYTQTKNHTQDATKDQELIFTFTDQYDKQKWIDGFSAPKKNVYKKEDKGGG